MKINFVLPPCPTISGGPLAILEYANRFIDLGHEVTVTTYPNDTWAGDSPFPWFNFKGEIVYQHFRDLPEGILPAGADVRSVEGKRELSDHIIRACGLAGLSDLVINSASHSRAHGPLRFLQGEVVNWAHLIDVMPDCDINIATFWSTAFPVYYSFKGKPVFFMQHYEEVFYPALPDLMLHKLMARMAYELPIFKVANSSWLQNLVADRFRQKVPFSNNAIEVSDFNPSRKLSEDDGILRIITYARPEEWKGFSDAVACMAKVINEAGVQIEWNVFGYKHPHLREDNEYARYRYHPKLSFKDLGCLYASSDIALCPSWYESFPLPPLEAMASGTATVTTAAGTEDYAIDEDTALVVQSRDIDGMANAVLRLVRDKHLRTRLAVSGRRTAERYTWDHAVKVREALLLDISSGRVEYDREASAGNGLVDAFGLPFEVGPKEAQESAEGLIWLDGALYLTYRGAKRHVLEGNLIPHLLEAGYTYVDVDPIVLARMPTGTPLASVHDMPQPTGLKAAKGNSAARARSLNAESR